MPGLLTMVSRWLTSSYNKTVAFLLTTKTWDLCERKKLTQDLMWRNLNCCVYGLLTQFVTHLCGIFCVHTYSFTMFCCILLTTLWSKHSHRTVLASIKAMNLPWSYHCRWSGRATEYRYSWINYRRVEFGPKYIYAEIYI